MMADWIWQRGLTIQKKHIFFNDGSYPANTSGVDVTIDGEDPVYNYFGRNMTCGDYNADERIDLAIGVQSNDGRVCIFYNDGTILTVASNADVIIDKAYNLGSALIGGDFNADGKAELGVGSSYNADLNFYIYAVDAAGTKPDYTKNRGGTRVRGEVRIR